MNREPHPCDDLPVGTWVWWCHHGQALEKLIEPGRNRVDYIYSNKPQHEQAVRLAAFRVAKDQAWAKSALARYDRVRQSAWAEFDRVRQSAWAEYEKIEQSAYAEYEKIEQSAYAEYEKIEQSAYAEYKRVRQSALALIFAKLNEEYPGVPYSRETGELIFPEAK